MDECRKPLNWNHATTLGAAFISFTMKNVFYGFDPEDEDFDELDEDFDYDGDEDLDDDW